MLEVRALRAGYGAINVLWDVGLRFATGQLTTIIGPNGAGKTTLLRAIMGLVPVTSGTITLDGAPIAGTATSRMAALGIALIPEGRMIFRDMTVEENLLLGAYPVRREGDVAARLAQACAMFPRLAERRRQIAGSLSGGEAQMLAMARGLMADPKLLLIDEPSLGLAPLVVKQVFDVIARINQAGTTVLLAEQNAYSALAIAHRAYVIERGCIALEGDRDSLLGNEAVRAAYIGA